LLEVRQGDGTYVRATSEVSGAVRRLCGSELREVLQVRRTLEVEGARMAATERTEAELANLTELLRIRDAALSEKRFDEFVQADASFHLSVVQCGHNNLLTELYRGLSEVVAASVEATKHADNVSHTGLLEAIADGDPERAVTEASGFLDELLKGIE
jgi:DNA-binding FadR family transcriptional regulator